MTEVNIFVADEQDEPLGTWPLRRLAQIVLEQERLPSETEVSLLFVSPSQIAEYNQRFMERRGPTDVLAFPLETLQPGQSFETDTNDAPLNIGDVVISPTTVRGRTDEMGVDFDDEMSLIVVHGLLHLLGYDHHDDSAAERMEDRERELLSLAGRSLR